MKIKHAFVDGGTSLNSFSINFLKMFGNKVMPKFVRKK